MHLDGSPGPLIRTFGRRGVFLLMFGVIYLVMGTSVLLVDASRFTAIPLVGPFLDHPLWGLMWLAAGITAIVNGAMRAWTRSDEIGFGALLIPPGAWSIFYATSTVVHLATRGDEGRTAVSGFAVWALVWFVVVLVSGWPDADPHAAQRRAEPPAAKGG